VSRNATVLSGRLVLDDRVEAGRVTVVDGWITAVEPGAASASDAAPTQYIAPAFVDVHVHGGGGHDAMGGRVALDGMARHLLRHGVTSFVPTAMTAPLDDLYRFVDDVRDWMPVAPADGAEPLGSNLEGPWLAHARKGAHDPTFLREPADLRLADLEAHLEGLRLVTVAPELPGALDLIAWLHGRGVAVSMGHSAATIDEARAGYAAGGTSTTHLFNGMSGVDHRDPGLAVAALTDDAAYTELIADGVHVHPALWPLVARLKPVDRLVLVSDAVPLAGMGDGPGRMGGLEVEVVGQRATLVGTSTLVGSVIALDDAVRNVVGAGIALPAAVAAASRNPLALLGVTDRGRIATGQRADLVELDDALRVRRVMRAGVWFDA
jgi:N-acetylglucosamine-6-phosphate deacetylase